MRHSAIAESGTRVKARELRKLIRVVPENPFFAAMTAETEAARAVSWRSLGITRINGTMPVSSASLVTSHPGFTTGYFILGER